MNSFQLEAAAAVVEADKQKKISALVRGLYVGLAAGDAETVGKMVKADLEWRFHGPPSCQHLMRVLTGHIDQSSFTFTPHSITALGHNLIVAEGRGDESTYWVHVWTVEGSGSMVTQLREYFNTSLVVTEFKPAPPLPSSCPLLVEKKACFQSPLWQSKIGKSKQKLMPGLVLAI